MREMVRGEEPKQDEPAWIQQQSKAWKLLSKRLTITPKGTAWAATSKRTTKTIRKLRKLPRYG
jgi:hypothetical protein